MNRVATLATAEKEKAIGEHTRIVQMPPERNEPSYLEGGTFSPLLPTSLLTLGPPKLIKHTLQKK